MAHGGPGTIRIVIGPRAGDDAGQLCEHVQRRLRRRVASPSGGAALPGAALPGAAPRGAACTVVCDVAALTEPDAGTIDALARLQLTVRRCGGELLLSGVPASLHELLALAGLCEVVGCGGDRGEGDRGEGVSATGRSPS